MRIYTPVKIEIIQNKGFNATSTLNFIQLTFNSSYDYNPTIGISSDGNNSIVIWESDRISSYLKLWMRSSNDGGDTWSVPKQITFGNSLDRDPDIVFDSKGTAFLIWCGEYLKTTIWIANSTDGGQSWSSPQNLTSLASYQTVPRIAVDAIDNLYVTWDYDGKIWIVKSSNAGVNWSNPIQLTTSGSDSPFIICRLSNYCFIGWHLEGTGNLYCYTSSADEGQTWKPPQALLQFGANEKITDVKFDNNGDIILLGNQYYSLFFMRSGNNGTTWSSKCYFLNQTSYTGRARFTVGSKGQGIIAWDGILDVFGHNWEIWIIRTDSSIDPDGDLLSTFQEQMIFHTNPNISDTDGDGLSDGEEINFYGTNPLNKDSDGDGFSDKNEVQWGTNPLSINDNPLTRSIFFVVPITIGVCIAIYWKRMNYFRSEKKVIIRDKVAVALGIPYLNVILVSWLFSVISSSDPYNPWIYGNPDGYFIGIGFLCQIPVFASTIFFLSMRDPIYEKIAFALEIPEWVLILMGMIIGIYYMIIDTFIFFLVLICLQIILGIGLYLRRNFLVKKIRLVYYDR